MRVLPFGLLAATAFATTLAVGACAQDSVSEGVETRTPATDVQSATTELASTGFEAPDNAWRTVEAENLLLVDTVHGRVAIELYPELAPAHVDRIRTLAKMGFYDGQKFHRVIDGFMNQTGDPTGTGTGDSGMPDLPPEFTFRRGTDMPVALVGAMRTPTGEMATGFYKSLPVATQPSSQAILTKDGKVEAYGLHCKGVTSMARTNDPNTANSQFFLMRGKSPWLDAQYSIWGNTVAGHDVLEKIQLTEVDGQPIEHTPDVMEDVTLASELPEAERPVVRVLDTQSDAFLEMLETQKEGDAYPEICDVRVPVEIGT